MNFATYFSKQARKPAGLFGRFFMSRVFEKGNVELNDLVFETLSIKENDRILEIGFGTGLLIKKIVELKANGIIEGIDLSATMVNMAKRKNRKHILDGKVDIHQGDFDEMWFEDCRFDTVFSVNTIYFWKKPEATVSKINRILKPGGKMVIGFHEKSEMENLPLSRDVFRYYSPDNMVELLSTHGTLNNVEIISKKGKEKTCHCSVGAKKRL